MTSESPGATAVCVDAVSCEAAAHARVLAARLALPLTHADDRAFATLLAVTDERVELRASTLDVGPVFCDFVDGAFGHRRRGQLRGEMLVKAIGYKGEPLDVVDATAGLGRDAVTLALVGCSVVAIERNASIHALLEDGIRRASERDEHLRQSLRDRLALHRSDAREHLDSRCADAAPDVVYIDPMFPQRDKSALVKKEMRVCRLVCGDDVDADDLFDRALRVATRRVVVKRALHAPPLAGPEPAVVRRGKSIRYDIYPIV